MQTSYDLTLAELCDRWGISRNAVKSRAASLQVELIRESSTRTVWPQEAIALGDRLHKHLQVKGATLADFPEAPMPVGGDAAPMPRNQQRGGGVGQLVKGDQATALMAHLMAAAAGSSATPTDPLQRARGLAEAADTELVLTANDLAALLGQGVSGWLDGHEAYGYRFNKHHQGRQVLWTVERAITGGSD